MGLHLCIELRLATKIVKNTLERVSNAVYCCINGVFRKLHVLHNPAMNIILRPNVSS